MKVPTVGHTYRHYKGGLYCVMAVGKCTTTKEPQVVYRPRHGDDVWIRSLAEWNAMVDHEGQMIHRFAETALTCPARCLQPCPLAKTGDPG